MKESVWRISTDVSLQAVLEEPACPPLLARVLARIPSWQVRNETTVARTLRATQLMPEWVAGLLALEAEATLEGNTGGKAVSLRRLIDRELKGHAAALQVRLTPSFRWGDARVSRTPSDTSIVAAFAVIRPEYEPVCNASITLTGVSPEPVFIASAASAIVGRALSPEVIADVVAAVKDEVEPEGDYLGSEEYRREMAGVLARRALEGCLRKEVAREE